MEKLLENKDEKILISLGLFMAALLIGYNAFFTPQMPSLVKNSGDIITDKHKKDDTPKHSKSGLININTASEEELIENLNGVGPAMAKKIIEYRENNGGFSSIEELMNIKGIGEKKFEKLKGSVTVE